jgi:hypothetical protein
MNISPMTEGPRRETTGDRFIPTRAGNKWDIKFALMTVSILNNLYLCE